MAEDKTQEQIAAEAAKAAAAEAKKKKAADEKAAKAAAKAAQAADKVGATALVVHTKRHPSRVFSAEVHGKDFKANAEEYAETHGGTIEKLK